MGPLLRDGGWRSGCPVPENNPKDSGMVLSHWSVPGWRASPRPNICTAHVSVCSHQILTVGPWHDCGPSKLSPKLQVLEALKSISPAQVSPGSGLYFTSERHLTAIWKVHGARTCHLPSEAKSWGLGRYQASSSRRIDDCLSAAGSCDPGGSSLLWFPQFSSS